MQLKCLVEGPIKGNHPPGACGQLDRGDALGGEVEATNRRSVVAVVI